MRYVHVSKPLVTIMNNGQLQTIVSPAKGDTLNVGRNAEKRAARAEDKATRSKAIKLCHEVHALDVSICGRLGGEPRKLVHIPKAHASKKVTAMLSDRRLRQRQQEGYTTRTAEAA
jgi:hypothetical protein